MTAGTKNQAGRHSGGLRGPRRPTAQSSALVPVPEFFEQLVGIPVSTGRREIKEGRFPFPVHRIGHRDYVERQCLPEYLARTLVQAGAE